MTISLLWGKKAFRNEGGEERRRRREEERRERRERKGSVKSEE